MVEDDALAAVDFLVDGQELVLGDGAGEAAAGLEIVADAAAGSMTAVSAALSSAQAAPKAATLRASAGSGIRAVSSSAPANSRNDSIQFISRSPKSSAPACRSLAS